MSHIKNIREIEKGCGEVEVVEKNRLQGDGTYGDEYCTCGIDEPCGICLKCKDKINIYLKALKETQKQFRESKSNLEVAEIFKLIDKSITEVEK